MKKLIILAVLILNLFAIDKIDFSKKVVFDIMDVIKKSSLPANVKLNEQSLYVIKKYKKKTDFLWDYAAVKRILIDKIDKKEAAFKVKLVSLYNETLVLELKIKYTLQADKIVIKHLSLKTIKLNLAKMNNIYKKIKTKMSLMKRIKNITNYNKIVNALNKYDSDKNFKMYFSLGTKYTTNATLVGEEQDEVKKENDISLNYSAQIVKTDYVGDTSNLIGAIINGNRYASTKMYNSDSIILYLNQNHYYDKYTLKDHFSFNYNFVDGKSFSVRLNVGVGLDYYWEKNTWSELIYNYSRSTYKNDVDPTQDKSGGVHYFSIGEKYKLKSLIKNYTTLLGVKLDYSKSITDGEAYHHHTLGYSLSIIQVLPRNYLLSALYSYNHAKYKNEDENIKDKRKDTTKSIDLILNKKYTDKLSYYLSVSYLNNSSNDSRNDFITKSIGCGIEYFYK